MSGVRLHFLTTLLNNLVEAAREEFWWHDAHFIHILDHFFDIFSLFLLCLHFFIVENSFNTIIFVVLWIGCRKENCVLFRTFLVYTEDQVDPLVNIFSDVLAFELFSENPCQVVGVHSVRRHHQLIYKQIPFQSCHFLLLGEAGVKSVSVLVHFWKKVVFWQKLGI